MERILYFLTIFVVVCAVLAASMGVTPHIGHYDFEQASEYIDAQSPVGDGSVMAVFGYYMDATVGAWEIWESYSGDSGIYAVRVIIPERPTHYVEGVPVYRSSVERRDTRVPLSPWRKVNYTDVSMPSGIDTSSVRRIYDAMQYGLFGLSSGNPSAVASNIAVTMAEEMAVSQIRVWRATFEAVLYIVGLTDNLG